jgi:serine/threonine protein kinase
MSLAPGTRLGVYEIAGPIGTGGMGEVYRARDTKLNRDVALKVLPAVFAADPERLARFKREAQLLASLNHPHIGAIYGLEETETVRALVLELVEGPTLAEVIERAQGSRLTAQGPDTSQSDSATSPKSEARSHIARQGRASLKAASRLKPPRRADGEGRQSVGVPPSQRFGEPRRSSRLSLASGGGGPHAV